MPRLLLLPLTLLAFAFGTLPFSAFAADIDYKKLPLAELKRLATQDDPSAQFDMGIRNLKGKGGMQRNVKDAVVWFLKAATQGYAPAQFSLYEMQNKGEWTQHGGEGLMWLRKAAEQDYAKALFEMGNRYAEPGTRTEEEKNNWFKRAFDVYSRLATEGDAAAQCGLGMMYYYGFGVQENRLLAAEWFEKSAKQGYAEALSFAGTFAKDDYEVSAWLRLAAEQGDGTDLWELGNRYANGRGVPYDPALAYALFILGTERSSNDVIHDNRERVAAKFASQLTPLAIRESQSIAKKWKVDTPLPTASKSGAEAVTKSLAASAPPTGTPPKKTGNCRPTSPSIRCQSRCSNGDCIVTYENGCEIRVQVQPKFNPFNSQWEYPSPGC